MLEAYKTLKIKSNIEISPNIFQIELERDFDIDIRPGQFFMLRGWEGRDPFLPRPISIAGLEKDSLTFLYEVRGRGTHIVSKLRVGDTMDILGPLGNGFSLDKKGKIAIISGGIGIAPLLYLLKNLKGQVDFYAGFRDEVYWIDELEKYAKKIYISTEDGSRGHKGYIVDIFNPKDYDHVLTCGPMPMMKKILDICDGEAEVEVSMESRMACGIGACLGCTIETVNGMERVCKEGPIFKVREVILNG